jgi:hypothetical protein
VGAVVGGNFAQVAVIVLGILYHQGKVTFNFCGIFRKMGFSWWRKTEDELLEKMKHSGGDVEGEFQFHVFLPTLCIQAVSVVRFFDLANPSAAGWMITPV